MIQLNWENMNQAETDFVNNLVRASIFDILITSEVETIINDGVFKSENNLQYVVKYAETFLPHFFNTRCLVKTPDGGFCCMKLKKIES